MRPTRSSAISGYFIEQPSARYAVSVRVPIRIGVVSVAAVLALGTPIAATALRAPSPVMVADPGCPDGYELFGVLIEKSGAAYLVCRDKEGGGLLHIPLSASKERTLDA